MSNAFRSRLAIAPALLLVPALWSPPADKVQLTIATLHAAQLTTPRAAGDSTDSPFFVVRVTGRNLNAISILPDAGQINLRRDQAAGARPLSELSIEQGDTVQIQISVMENVKAKKSDESRMTAAGANAGSAEALMQQATAMLAPLVKDGSFWMGSANLLLTNEGGSIYWRKLDCVKTCTVLNAPASSALAKGQGQPNAGVVELSGNGGTYHLALNARAQ